MLLMIDNYDSFTYNLVQYLGELGSTVKVFRNDEIGIEQIEAKAGAEDGGEKREKVRAAATQALDAAGIRYRVS